MRAEGTKRPDLVGQRGMEIQVGTLSAWTPQVSQTGCGGEGPVVVAGRVGLGVSSEDRKICWQMGSREQKQDRSQGIPQNSMKSALHRLDSHPWAGTLATGSSPLPSGFLHY